MNGNPFYEPYWDTELEHHGVKGMHWGERRTPEQLGHKPKKKRNNIIKNFKKKAAKRKAQAAKAKQKKKVQNEQKKEQLTEKQKEELREKLLKSTDPKFIAKHMDLLETKEIQDRINRIDTEAKLKKLTVDDKKKKQVEKGMEWVANISKIAETTSKVADAYSKTYDAVNKKKKGDREEQEARETSRSRREASKELNSVLKKYNKDYDSLSDITIDFDPKTGKLSFKSTKGEKEKEEKEEKKKKTG